MAVARCVFPSPLEPIKIIFVFVSMNLKLFKSAICSLFTDGWYKKSKSLNVLMYGKCDVVILIFFALSARNSISAFVSSSKESTRDVLFFVDLSITFGRISSILVSASSSMLFFNTLKLVIYLKIPFCNSCNFIIGKPSQRATSCNFHIVLMIEICNL